jgi:hypothetical protein
MATSLHHRNRPDGSIALRSSALAQGEPPTMSMIRVQHAIQFLARLRSAGEVQSHEHIAVSTNFEDKDLVLLAASFGYEVDFDSIAEAFRVRMLAREIVRRKGITEPAQSQ